MTETPLYSVPAATAHWREPNIERRALSGLQTHQGGRPVGAVGSPEPAEEGVPEPDEVHPKRNRPRSKPREHKRTDRMKSAPEEDANAN